MFAKSARKGVLGLTAAIGAVGSPPCLSAPELSGAEIRKFRLSLDLTQEQFASEFDIPLGTLRRWERGANTPRANEGFLRLLDAVWHSQRKKKRDPWQSHHKLRAA